jgi:single-stranded-DNA-specific exonuclease
LNIKLEEFFSIKPDFLSLAALGTIADRVPLQDENRILIKYGLQELKNAQRSVLQALLAEEQINPVDLTVEKFISVLLPLFASANGQDACHFFLSQDYEKIKQWLKNLADQRDVWREETRQALNIAKNVLDFSGELVIVKSDKLPLRTMGHCASKLREQYQVPAIVIGKGKENWIGECRGVDQVNLIDLLKANSHYFIDFGGHKKACGFSIPEVNLEAFINAAKDYAHNNFKDKIQPETILIDAILPLPELTEEFAQLGPFGEGNPAPLLIAPKTHIKLSTFGELIALENPKLRLFNNSEQIKLSDGIFDLLYTFDENLNVYIKQAVIQ